MAIESIILNVRNKKVIIDRDLAQLYEVETKYLNRQVRRNLSRFPDEFMFRLTKIEKAELVTNWHQFGNLKHSYSLPYAFTEHGVAMLASVLNSDVAVKVSILIIKTFIRLRTIAIQYADLSKKLDQIESKTNKHDNEIQAIIHTLRGMMVIPEKPKRQIGFHVKE